MILACIKWYFTRICYSKSYHPKWSSINFVYKGRKRKHGTCDFGTAAKKFFRTPDDLNVFCWHRILSYRCFSCTQHFGPLDYVDIFTTSVSSGKSIANCMRHCFLLWCIQPKVLVQWTSSAAWPLVKAKSMWGLFVVVCRYPVPESV